MGFDPTDLPNDVLKRMDKADRKAIGRAAITTEEAQAKQAVKLEKELHEQCLSLLRIRGIFCIHSRMDRKSTIPEGTPDLCFAMPSLPAACDGVTSGIPCAVELKLPGEHPEPEQVKVMEQMMNNGWIVRVITSVEAFKIFLDRLSGATNDTDSDI